MTEMDLDRVVQSLESTAPALGSAYEDAVDTIKLWSPLDRGRLPELVRLLERPSPSVTAYALTAMGRIGGDLDAYLELICGCARPRKARGVCDGAMAAIINSEIAAIVRASILAGSTAARRCGEELIREKAVGWFDRLQIGWALRNQRKS